MMKKLMALTLALMLALTLAACGGNTTPPANNTPDGGNTNTPSGGGSDSSPPVSDNGGDPGDNDDYTAYDNATDQQRTLGERIFAGMAEEHGGDVIITFYQRSTDEPYENIAVLRGDSRNNLSVHAVLPKENRFGYDRRIYIDSGAAGSGYWYAIVGATDSVTGVPSSSWIQRPMVTDQYRWYKGADGYVSLFMPSITPDSVGGESIFAFDLDGYMRFTVESGQLNYDGEVHGRDWQYRAMLPLYLSYPVTGHSESVWILFDYDDAMFEFFGVFDTHSNPSPYAPCEPALYSFVRY
jgi:predicted small lipoprotein YifL